MQDAAIVSHKMKQTLTHVQGIFNFLERLHNPIWVTFTLKI